MNFYAADKTNSFILYFKNLIVMKKERFKPLMLLFGLFISCGLIFSACKKDDEDEPEEEQQEETSEAGPVYPRPEGADGVLVAIETNTFTSQFGLQIATPFGTAVAVFPVGSSFVDAGAVKVNNKALTKQDNNAYVYMPSLTDASGIDFSTVDWEVAGTSSVPAISHSVTVDFPKVSPISGDPSTVDVSAGFTLETENAITGADSVIFSVLGSKTLMVTKAGTMYSHTFSASELNGLSGTGYVQITAYSSETSNEGGKMIYYINESVVTNMVEFK